MKLGATFNSIKKDARKCSLVVLIDGSGSVQEKDFDGPLKTGVRTLIAQMRGAKITIMQFSTETKTYIQESEDLNECDKIVREMTQFKCGTYTKDAIIQVQNLLRGSSCPMKVVCLITDGKPSVPEQHPNEEIKVMKAMGITVFGIGIGNGIDKKLINELSTSGVGFLINDYDEFKIFTDSLVSDTQAAVYDAPRINVDFVPQSSSFKEGETITFTIHLRNNTTSNINGPIYIKFDQNSYFSMLEEKVTQNIGGSQVTSHETKLIPLTGVNLFQFPGKILITLKVGDYTQTGYLRIPTALLRKQFCARLYDSDTNIAVIGYKGSGKSSFINGVITIMSMSNDIVLDVCPVGSAADHVTNEYTKVRLRDFIEKECSDDIPFNVFDFWGESFDPVQSPDGTEVIPKSSYSKVSLNQFFNGGVRLNSHRVSIAASDVLKSPNLANEIHVVVIVTTLTSYMVRAKWDYVAAACKIAQDEHYSPVIIVTRVDQFEDAETREKHKKMLIERAPVSNIHFVTNYTGTDRTRDLDKDTSLLKALKAIDAAAAVWKKKKGADHFDNILWNSLYCRNLKCNNFNKTLENRCCGACGNFGEERKLDNDQINRLTKRNQCLNAQCSQKGVVTWREKCEECKSACKPPPPSGPDPTPQNSRKCATIGCPKMGESTAQNFCGSCGKGTIVPSKSTSKRCTNKGCSQFGVPTEQNFCGDCGFPTAAPPNSSNKCTNSGCSLFGVPTEQKFCGSCGSPTTAPASINAKKCTKTGCRQFGLPTEQNFCGGCGFATSASSAKRCTKNGCSQFGIPTEQNFCGGCGLSTLAQESNSKKCGNRDCLAFNVITEQGFCGSCGKPTSS